MTAFVAEQLATAHWFDQRETRAALDWAAAGRHRRGPRSAGGVLRLIPRVALPGFRTPMP